MFLLNASHGNTTISLYTKVPNANKKNPISSSDLKVSQPSIILQIHINIVLEQSIVALEAADAYFVIERPQALNAAIEMMMPMH